MDTKSLNCSVFFNPSNGRKDDKMPSDSRKPEMKQPQKRGECPTEGKLFTITYFPENSPKALENSAAILEENATSRREGADQSGSSVEIEECILPNRESEKHLKMNYVIDVEKNCRSCLEMKNALDYTFQKVFDESKKREAEKEKREMEKREKEKREKEKREIERQKSLAKDTKRKCRHRKQYRKAETNSENLTDLKLNEVEDTGPLMEIFSRLVRSATISRMKKFSRCVEETLSQREKATAYKNSFKDSVEHKGTEENEQKIKEPQDYEDVCQFCERLRQVMYNAVTKLYEEAGMKTDFPAVQKLETNVFLVYPDGATCRKALETKRKRSFTSRDSKRDSSNDAPKKPQKMNKKRKSEEVIEDESRKLLRLRIKRHKAAFSASKLVHVAAALVVSFSAMFLMSTDLEEIEPPHGSQVGVIMVVLFCGCIFNLYLMLFRKTFSFKNYYIIPVCWIILTVTNGKCADELMPNHVCNAKLHFMSHVYLFIVFLEYYLASGIHAVLVLEINHFRRIPSKDLLKYSIFNMPLMVIVLLYIVYRFFAEMKKRAKRYLMKSGRNKNT